MTLGHPETRIHECPAVGGVAQPSRATDFESVARGCEAHHPHQILTPCFRLEP